MLKNKVFSAALISIISLANLSCSADAGPSDEIAKRDINKFCLKATQSLAGCSSQVLSREQVSSDLVKLKVEWRMVRTEKKAPMKQLAMAVMTKRRDKEAFYRAGAGTVLSDGTKGTLTYVKKGDSWAIDGIEE